MKLTLAFAALGLSAIGMSQSFSNLTPIAIPTTGTSGPAIPSNIAVSGVTGTVLSVTVDIFNFSHTFPRDVDILLVNSSNQGTILMSDIGGSSTISNVSVTLDDAASQSFDPVNPFIAGTFKPTNNDTTTDNWTSTPAPPAGPYGSTLAGLIGGNVNGTWTLFIEDDLGGDSGSITGWQLNFRTQAVPEPATMAVLGIGALALARRRRKN